MDHEYVYEKAKAQVKRQGELEAIIATPEQAALLKKRMHGWFYDHYGPEGGEFLWNSWRSSVRFISPVATVRKTGS